MAETDAAETDVVSGTSAQELPASEQGGDLLEALLSEEDPLAAIERESLPPEQIAPEEDELFETELQEHSVGDALEALLEGSLPPDAVEEEPSTRAPTGGAPENEAEGNAESQSGDEALASALSSMLNVTLPSETEKEKQGEDNERGVDGGGNGGSENDG